MEPLKSYQDTREVKENFPSESQSSEVQLYQYQYITSRFGKNVKNEELKKKIDQFFAPTHFFTKHATLEFFYGVANDTRKHLLLSEDSVKTIHRELEIFTSSNIPIPTFQNNPYQNVEATFIDSAATFTKINKELKKYNKKIRANYKLDSMKAAWERAQSMFKEKKYLFVAVDVESYERDHSCILEVGWSMFDSKNNSFMDRHFCVSEYKYLRNGQFVPDKKDRFSFGETVWANLKSIGSEIVGDLTEEKVKGNVVFIGHDIQMDVKYLESMGVDVKGVINPVDYFDTAEMNAARVGKPYERINLGRLLDDLDIENYCLHNAGNDAHYTLLLFLELCKLPLQPPEEHTSNSD